MRFFSGVMLVLAATLAAAQEYPSRPIRLLMPNSPGSSIDTVGRIVAVGLGEALGQPLVVDNRAGAAGAIGIEAAKTAAPDGYTLLFASASGMSIAPLLRKNVTYDPLNDFGFVSLVVVMPNVLVVTPSLPVHNVGELVAYAKARPGQVNMASAGLGAASHLGGVLLQVTRLRAIAHSLPRRSPLFGDLPAVAETLPGYDYSGWAGLLAPKGLAPAQVERLRAALVQVLATAKIREALAAQGAEPQPGSPEEFRAFLQRDLEATARVVKAARIEAE